MIWNISKSTAAPEAKDKIYIEWDVAAWRPALRLWETAIAETFTGEPVEGLEIGARNGGLTLFFSERLRGTIRCTDIGAPASRSQDLHGRHEPNSRIIYEEFDVLRPKYPPNVFDYVVFKSVMGAVGHSGHKENQAFAFNEIYRMLKPGGILFFAENLEGSFLHQWARRSFVPWGRRWRYVALHEINDFLAPFSKKHIRTTGFLSAFARNERLKALLHSVDDVASPIIPSSLRYVIYGYAAK